MLFLALASVILVTVHGQTEDPTKVCLPDVLQIHVSSLNLNISGILVYNFSNDAVAVRLGSEIRQVFDLSGPILHIINETDGRCARSTPPDDLSVLFSQCLPAGARLVTQPGTELGLTPGSLEIEGWEYNVPNFGTEIIAITKNSPRIPILRRFISTGSLSSDIDILLNGKTSIDDPSIFNVPAVCPTATVVG